MRGGNEVDGVIPSPSQNSATTYITNQNIFHPKQYLTTQKNCGRIVPESLIMTLILTVN